jgi:hypothetical protein
MALRPRVLGSLSALSLIAFASEPRAEPDRQQGPRMGEARSESVTRPDGRALVGGSVLFAASYGLALSAVDGYGLAVPVAGPWISLAHGEGSEELALDGVAQLGGVVLIAGSFMFPERTLGPARAAVPALRLGVGAAGPKLVVLGEF